MTTTNRRIADIGLCIKYVVGDKYNKKSQTLLPDFLEICKFITQLLESQPLLLELPLQPSSSYDELSSLQASLLLQELLR
jgi:hypothetical protein